MLLCTYEREGRTAAGVIGAGRDRVFELARALGRGDEGFRDVRAVCEWLAAETPHELPVAAALKERLGPVPLEMRRELTPTPLPEVRLLAPVLRPPKITALGLNYRDHAREQKAELPKAPLLFAKARTSIAGPSDPILIPEGAEKVDYEVELGLVIGRGGFGLPRDEARRHLLGYTILVDVSERGAQFGDKQWYRGKSYPTFAPSGPFVATADALDPGAGAGVRLTTKLNGTVMQDGTTADLIFGVDEVLAYVSRVTPLEPGDLIATGTPAGVGVFRDPPVFLKPGDRLECAIEGIGALALDVRGGAPGHARPT